MQGRSEKTVQTNKVAVGQVILGTFHGVYLPSHKHIDREHCKCSHSSKTMPVKPSHQTGKHGDVRSFIHVLSSVIYN